MIVEILRLVVSITDGFFFGWFLAHGEWWPALLAILGLVLVQAAISMIVVGWGVEER